MIVAFFNFDTDLVNFLDLTKNESVPTAVKGVIVRWGNWLTFAAFGALALVLLAIGARKGTDRE